MKHKMKNTLKPGSIAIGVGLMLTTLCYGQASRQHNVIYWDGDSTNLPTLAGSAYTDVIVDFILPDQYCNLGSNGGLPGDIQNSVQMLHNAGKTVLVSFGGQDKVQNNVDLTSEGYQACYYNLLGQGPLYSWVTSQIETIVNTNGFDGVDIDFEDNSGFNGAYDGVDFLLKLTADLYSYLPPGHNIITHTPQTPYFTQTFNGYATPPYALIWQNVKALGGVAIAWFNLQTYNNNCPISGYDCTAQEKIADYQNIVNTVGVPSGRLVMGVPVSWCGTTDNSGNCTGDGFLSYYTGNGNDLWTAISSLEQDYPNQFGGVMGWNYSLDLQSDFGNWSQVIAYYLSVGGSANADQKVLKVSKGNHQTKKSCKPGCDRN